ncbi:uncharacterized protein V1513DRAFT_454639 [Lipomyces chichibuensis]|uniref:uncharacterized protein n=1 Tax=Lipomyces chichibuensis TaxID=1546026 RepID=UPI0033439791
MSTQMQKDTARIRENHYRRRRYADRMQYVDQLQKQWQRCDQIRIETNVHTQNIARKITAENQHLIAMLLSHGVTQSCISEHLRSGHDCKCLSPPIIDHTDQSSRLDLPDIQPRQNDPYENITVSTNIEDDGAIEAQHSVARDEFRGQIFAPESRHTNVALPMPAESTTSCVRAAAIIASMSLNINAEEASIELGCSGGMDCVVDNLKIFAIMDQSLSGNDHYLLH